MKIELIGNYGYQKNISLNNTSSANNKQKIKAHYTSNNTNLGMNYASPIFKSNVLNTLQKTNQRMHGENCQVFINACAKRKMKDITAAMNKYLPIIQKYPLIVERLITEKVKNDDGKNEFRMQSMKSVYKILDVFTPETSDFIIKMLDRKKSDGSYSFTNAQSLINCINIYKEFPMTTEFLMDAKTSENKPRIEEPEFGFYHLCKYFEDFENFDNAKKRLNFLLNLRDDNNKLLTLDKLRTLTSPGFYRLFKMYESTGLFKFSEMAEMSTTCYNDMNDCDTKMKILNVKMKQKGTRPDEQLREEIKMLTTVSSCDYIKAYNMAVKEYSPRQIEEAKHAAFIESQERWESKMTEKEVKKYQEKAIGILQKYRVSSPDLERQIRGCNSREEIKKCVDNYVENSNLYYIVPSMGTLIINSPKLRNACDEIWESC